MPVDSTGLAHAVPPEPWRSFLHDFDAQLKGAVALRCLGGFVVTQQYGIGRGTSDIDFLSVTAVSAEDNVEVLGGLGSDLYKKYRVYLQYVGIATPPCDYADRLQRMFPRARWTKLQLFALDPVDLALSKLERNSDRDREDVLRLAQAGYIDCGVLKARYLEELRPLQALDATTDYYLVLGSGDLPHCRPTFVIPMAGSTFVGACLCRR